MKVLHVSTSDSHGGAGIAAYSIHKSLLATGIDSRFLSARSLHPGTLTHVPKAISALGNKLRSKTGQLISTLYSHPPNTSLNILPSSIHHFINRQHPDLVHLHWINAEYVPLSSLLQIKAPIVWSLHDLWPVTLFNHIPTINPHLDELSKIAIDRPCPFASIANKINKLQGLAVGPSTYMSSLVPHSNSLGKWQVLTIPHPISDSFYHRYDKQLCRQKLGLSPSARVILYASAYKSSDKNKGYELLIRSLQHLCQEYPDLILLCISSEHQSDQTYPKIHQLPSTSLESMPLAYVAADVTCVPSYFESFSLVAAESQACGTPVVAFDTSGLKSTVVHEQTGLLVPPYSTQALSRALSALLKPPLNRNLSANARIHAQKWRQKVVAGLYMNAYYSLLSNSPIR